MPFYNRPPREKSLMGISYLFFFVESDFKTKFTPNCLFPIDTFESAPINRLLWIIL
jgi:hypothetical protein